MPEMLNNFHFLRPYWLLLSLPLVIVLIVYARRRLQAGGWNRVCDERLLPYVLIGQRQVQSALGLLTIGVCGLVAVIALAGPAWKQLPHPIFSSQAALVIALDLSHSMDVEDIKPSRLARARHKILDILNKRREGQTALIVYAAESFVVTPLTEDTNTVATLVKDLSTDLMPTQGSYPEKAISRAIELFKQSSVVNGHVLLVTDGVDSAGMNDAVQKLTGAGFHLSVLGVGTPQGAPIVDYRGGFVKNRQGAIVVAKLDEQQLAQVALRGQGIYRRISADDRDINDLLQIISTSRLKDNFNRQQDSLKVHSDQWQEEGPWLLLLLLPFTALAFRRGYLVLLLALMIPLPRTSQAFDWSSLWKNPDQRAQQALQSGDSKTAATLFKDPQWKAAANFRAGDYQQSVQALESLNTPDALYNKATALAKLGQLQQAVDTYNQVLEKDPQNADAKYNRNVLQEYLKKNQQSSPSQDDNKSDSQNNQSQDKQSQDNQSQQDQSQDSQSKEDKNKDGQSQQQAQDPSGQHNADKDPSDNAQSSKQQSAQNDQTQSKPNQAKAQDTQKDQTGQQPQPEQKSAGANDTNKDKSEPQKTSEQTAQDVQQLQEEMEKQRQAQSAVKPEQESPAQSEQRPGQVAQTEQQREATQKTEQWLRRIPDDPGGLLRRKFRIQSQIDPRKAQGEIQPW